MRTATNERSTQRATKGDCKMVKIWCPDCLEDVDPDVHECELFYPSLLTDRKVMKMERMNRWEKLFDNLTDLTLNEQAKIFARFFAHLEVSNNDKDYEYLKKLIKEFKEN
jgi:hypothetical protein